jgi:hypothetical protein
MKIRFFQVTGNVAIDDKYSFRDARTGMVLETGGNPYLIVTGDNSFATLVIETKTISLGPNSAMHVNYPQPCQMRGTVHDLKIIVGKLWKMIDRHEWKPEQGNAAIGVRG